MSVDKVFEPDEAQSGWLENTVLSRYEEIRSGKVKPLNQQDAERLARGEAAAVSVAELKNATRK